MSRQHAQARRRAELILKVRAGQMTASEAAKRLGVSRKTYYKWEQRALEGMLEGLCERNSGRPACEPDEEKENLKKKVMELERELKAKQQSEELRKLLKAEMGKKG
jgi:transposase